MDAERRQRPRLLALGKGGRQEFDKRIAARLLPAPDLAIVQRWSRVEREVGEQLLQALIDAVTQGQREALEARNVDVVGLRGVIDAITDAEFAFVESEGDRADERAAKPKDTRIGHRGKQAAGSGIDAQKAFRPQHPNEARSLRAPLDPKRAQLCGASQALPQFVAILADIGLFDLRADAIAVVPIKPPIPLDPRRRPTQFGNGLVPERAQQVMICGMSRRRMAGELDHATLNKNSVC